MTDQMWCTHRRIVWRAILNCASLRFSLSKLPSFKHSNCYRTTRLSTVCTIPALVICHATRGFHIIRDTPQICLIIRYVIVWRKKFKKPPSFLSTSPFIPIASFGATYLWGINIFLLASTHSVMHETCRCVLLVDKLYLVPTSIWANQTDGIWAELCIKIIPTVGIRWERQT